MGMKAGRPEYAEVNAQVLLDVRVRVERAFAAFFRRVKAREEPGYPRFQGKTRYHSFTYPLFHLSAVWHRSGAGQRHPQPIEDRAYPDPAASSAGRHAQDRHNL